MTEETVCGLGPGEQRTTCDVAGTDLEDESRQLDITELRGEIDAINHEILDLFARRMEVSRHIAEYKRAHGMRVADFARERQILDEVSGLAPEGMESYATVLFSTLMDMSRSYQEQHLRKDTPLRRSITEALAEAPVMFPRRALVAVQGVEGAYAQLACERVFKHPTISYRNSFEGVFNAVEQGECEFGIVPVENSTAGSVNRVFDLMMQHQFHIVRTVRVKVDHCLLAPAGCDLSRLTTVYSHEQALAQCSQFFEEHPHIHAVAVENTAVAARMVAQGGRDDVAALASRGCAELYGLDILASAIQNEGSNFTRFACIAKDLTIYPGADRASLSLVTPHRPGALCRVLSRFYSLDINVVKLESRPLHGRDFEFMFYFDIEIPAAAPEFADSLCQIADLCEEFRYLGSYSEVH